MINLRPPVAIRYESLSWPRFHSQRYPVKLNSLRLLLLQLHNRMRLLLLFCVVTLVYIGLIELARSSIAKCHYGTNKRITGAFVMRSHKGTFSTTAAESATASNNVHCHTRGSFALASSLPSPSLDKHNTTEHKTAASSFWSSCRIDSAVVDGDFLACCYVLSKLLAKTTRNYNFFSCRWPCLFLILRHIHPHTPFQGVYINIFCGPSSSRTLLPPLLLLLGHNSSSFIVEHWTGKHAANSNAFFKGLHSQFNSRWGGGEEWTAYTKGRMVLLAPTSLLSLTTYNKPTVSCSIKGATNFY